MGSAVFTQPTAEGPQTLQCAAPMALSALKIALAHSSSERVRCFTERGLNMRSDHKNKERVHNAFVSLL